MLDLLATVALLSCGWTVYLLAARWLPDAPASVRWCAAAIAGYWLLVASFFALASLTLFRAGVAIPLWVAGAVALHAAGLGRAGVAALGRDWRCAVAGWTEWRRTRYGVLLVAAGSTVLALRFVRSMVAPPLTWDALTYHLLKAGRWVQTGGFVPERAPDAWGYYEFFQPFGDYLWAWAMLPVHGDLLIGPAGVLVWATCLLATYALARALGIAGAPAVAAALFVAFNPTVFNYMTSAHVENVLLATFVLGAVFIARSFTHRGWINPTLAAAALGVMAGVKFNGAPVALVGMVAVGLAVVRLRLADGSAASRTYRAAALGACALACALGMQPYLRAWAETGSPSYPFQVAVAGRTLFAGNSELTWLMARDEALHGPLFQELFVPQEFDLIVGREQFLNPGPAALLIALTGLAGAIAALRRRGPAPSGRARRPVAIYLLTASAITVAGVATSDVSALRALWTPVFGRFLIVALTAAAIFTACLAPRISTPLLLGATALGVPLTIPLGWGPTDRLALADPRLLIVVGAVGLVALAGRLTAARSARPGPAYLAGVIVAATGVGSWVAVREVREAHRHAYFRDAAEERLYDPQRLAYKETAGYPLWRRFDGARGVSIAVSAGWNEYGHNWFRYPLLGSRLQNRVVYVPITRDGAVVDYRDADRLDAGMDYEAWLRRLIEARIDYLVLLHPEPPETAWVRAHPEVFAPAGDGRAGMASAYRLNLDIAAAALERRQGDDHDVTPQVASR